MVMLAHDLGDLTEIPHESLSGCSCLAATIIGAAEPTGGPPVTRRRR